MALDGRGRRLLVARHQQQPRSIYATARHPVRNSRRRLRHGALPCRQSLCPPGSMVDDVKLQGGTPSAVPRRGNAHLPWRNFRRSGALCGTVPDTHQMGSRSSRTLQAGDRSHSLNGNAFAPTSPSPVRPQTFFPSDCSKPPPLTR